MWYNFLFPSSCVLCKASGMRGFDICSDCASELSKNFSTTRLDNIIALAHYEQPIAKLIIDLKFKERLVYSRVLGELLAKKLGEYYQGRVCPELIIPVPLHKKRLRVRGFNQALELAKPIAKSLKISLDRYSCVRVKHTLAQSSLKFQERQRNIKQAFVVQKPILARHVAIVDDVVTTGSTIAELSAVLYKAGINTIDVWCCARVE